MTKGNFSRLSSSPRYYHLCGCPVMTITSNFNCCFHCCNYFHTRIQHWAGSKCRTDLMAFTLVQHMTVLSSAVSQALTPHCVYVSPAYTVPLSSFPCTPPVFDRLQHTKTGVLGKRRPLHCGQPLSVELDHAVSGGQEKRRQMVSNQLL